MSIHLMNLHSITGSNSHASRFTGIPILNSSEIAYINKKILVDQLDLRKSTFLP